VPSAEKALKLLDQQGGTLAAAVPDVNLGGDKTTYPVADRLTALGVPFLFATAKAWFHLRSGLPGLPAFSGGDGFIPVMGMYGRNGWVYPTVTAPCYTGARHDRVEFGIL